MHFVLRNIVNTCNYFLSTVKLILQIINLTKFKNCYSRFVRVASLVIKTISVQHIILVNVSNDIHVQLYSINVICLLDAVEIFVFFMKVFV